MSWRGGSALRVLLAAVALLLSLGGWAAATVDDGRATSVMANGRVGAAGTGEVGLLEDPGTTTTVPVSITAPTPPPFPKAPTTTRPASATTAPQRSTTTTSPAAPGPTTTAVPGLTPGNIAPASAWKADVPGLSIRLRMEPERPVAGQTVRFRLDVTSVDRCCHLFFNPGDDHMWILHNQLACTFEHELTPGGHSFVIDHTYAEPRAYLAEVRIHDGSMCEPFPATGPPFRHIEMPACVGVGPGTEAAKGCRPAPTPFPFLPPAA